MTSADTATLIIASTFVVLIALERKYRRRRLRVGTALLALAVLAFCQPKYTTAQRRALAAPPTARITSVPYHAPVSAYESGVRTAMQAVSEEAGFGEGARLAALGALMWLGCMPALLPTRGSGESSDVRSA